MMGLAGAAVPRTLGFEVYHIAGDLLQLGKKQRRSTFHFFKPSLDAFRKIPMNSFFGLITFYREHRERDSRPLKFDQ